MEQSGSKVTWNPAPAVDPTSVPETKDNAEQASRRIHMLGLGSIGILVAHSLRGLRDPPPVTLLMHRLERASKWVDGRQELRLTTHDRTESRGGYDWEYAIPMWRKHGKPVSVAEAQRLDELVLGEYGEGRRPHEQVQELEGPAVSEEFDKNATAPIRNLIVTVKAQQTVSALMAIKRRLSPESTILFLQNGMGITDEVNKHVFPDPETRPQYMLGINSHGAHRKDQDPFSAIHAGFGTIALGLAPRSSRPASPAPDGEETIPFSDVEMASSSRYLLRTLTSIPVLAAVGFSPTELFKAQLEKLAVNAVINPLTAMLDCRNGALLYNFSMTRLMRLLLAEISSVFIRLPELQGLTNVNTRFSPERLETLCVGLANKTAENVSSMLADVRGGRQTEVRYINGYVVKRGEDVGVTPGFNYFVLHMVLGKQMMVRKEEGENLPFVKET